MKILMWVIAIITLVSLACAAFAGDPPAPLALNLRALGGGPLNPYTPGVDRGTGLNNIGLLVKTWGNVTYVDTTNKFFYIDDGTGRIDGTRRTDGSLIPGVRVSYDNLAIGNYVNPPSTTNYVMITGISSTILIDGKIQPNLRPRRNEDVQLIR